MWLYLMSVSNCAEQNITSCCQIVSCPLCSDDNYKFNISQNLSNNNASVDMLRLDGHTRGLSALWEKYWLPKAVLWCTKSPEVDGTGPPHLGSVVYSCATNTPLILKFFGGKGGVGCLPHQLSWVWIVISHYLWL